MPKQIIDSLMYKAGKVIDDIAEDYEADLTIVGEGGEWELRRRVKAALADRIIDYAVNKAMADLPQLLSEQARAQRAAERAAGYDH